jgi:hypothetical protein
MLEYSFPAWSFLFTLEDEGLEVYPFANVCFFDPSSEALLKVQFHMNSLVQFSQSAVSDMDSWYLRAMPQKNVITVSAEKAGWFWRHWIHFRKWIGTKEYDLPVILQLLEKIDRKAIDTIIATSEEFNTENFLACLQARTRKYTQKHPAHSFELRSLGDLFQTVVGTDDTFWYGENSGNVREDFSNNEKIVSFLKEKSKKSVLSLLHYVEKRGEQENSAFVKSWFQRRFCQEDVIKELPTESFLLDWEKGAVKLETLFLDVPIGKEVSKTIFQRLADIKSILVHNEKMFSQKDQYPLPLPPIHISNVEITSLSPKERDFLRLSLFPFGTERELLDVQEKLPTESAFFSSCSSWIRRRFSMPRLAFDRAQDLKFLTTLWDPGHLSEEEYLDVVYFLHSHEDQVLLIQAQLHRYIQQIEKNSIFAEKFLD